MKIVIFWAALLAAQLTYAMHVSSDDDARKSSCPKLVALTNFAAKPPAKILKDSSSEDSSSQDEAPQPVCFGNMNKHSTGLYSHMYTYASVEKKQGT